MKKIITLLFVAAAFSSFAQTQQPRTEPATQQPKTEPAATRPRPTQADRPKPAAETPKTEKEIAAMKEQGMKAWMEYMTPGAMHEMLAKSNGDWKEEITFWMTPGGPPEKHSGTCSNKMILGGRYQETTSKGDMDGMPFEGNGIVGYDNAKKVFVNTWIDNMGTGIVYMQGRYEEATRTVHFKGSMVDPMTKRDMRVREEFKIIDDNNQLMEMYQTDASGKEYKSMEIKFTR